MPPHLHTRTYKHTSSRQRSVTRSMVMHAHMSPLQPISPQKPEPARAAYCSQTSV